MDEGQDANPVRVLEFIRITLLLWDKYEENERAYVSLRHLVYSFHKLSNPLYMYEDLYDLLEYIGGDVSHSTRRSKHTGPSALKGRALYEQVIQEQFGENSPEISLLDQLLFTDVGYYLLYLCWFQLGAIVSLDDVLQMLKAEIPGKPIPALTELADRVRARSQALFDDNKWNDEHNTRDTPHWDGTDDASFKWFYEKAILPQYAEVDVEDIDWEMNHVKVGENAFAYYFKSSGRAYILVTAVDDDSLDFKPSPMYELVKSNGHNFLEIRRNDGISTIPRLFGTYRLYAERLASS